MMEDTFLGLLITEKLYVLPEQLPAYANEVIQNSTPDLSAANTTRPDAVENLVIQTEHVKLLVISEPMTPTEQEMLQKIMQALAMTESNFKITQEKPENITAEKILFFSPQQTCYYQVVNHENTPTLFSPPLGTIAQDIDSKKKLWAALKAWIV